MVALLVALVVSLAVGARILYVAIKHDSALVLPGMFAWFVLCVCPLALLGLVGAKATSGLYPGYSEGERTGYVTKLSRKGIIWKTWEAQIQPGTGHQAALQAPFSFSVSDDALAERVRIACLGGGLVKVHYSEWLLMPYSVGESGYEATWVEEIK